MSFTRVPQGLWMMLSHNEREHLTKVFNIPRSGPREIVDQTPTKDGHSDVDLEQSLTSDAMSEYVGSTESFPRLWELTVAKCKYELNPPKVIELNSVSPETFKNMSVLNEESKEVFSPEELAAKPTKNAKKSK